MSWMYRGKEIFKPLNTGWIDENVACVREWVANIFFYRKGDTTIMVDAGYNYDRLAEKMGWLGIDPKSIHHILITHQDTGHVAGVPCKVGDTNGAGDTFFGAALSKLCKEELDTLTVDKLESILAFANKAASITTSRHGAIPAMPTLAEVEG